MKQKRFFFSFDVTYSYLGVKHRSEPSTEQYEQQIIIAQLFRNLDEMKLLPTVLLLVAAAVPACSIPHISEIIERIHEQKLDPQMQLEVEFSNSHDDVQSLTFDQRRDHFSKDNDNE